eukprot:GFYU01018612.1.p1 GENE.GFYU01018612.1~~GFYU01018612.1.p1  ORF type:complete len:319 (-),score=74.15 GFYU01018612.1:344-1300(-)
MAQEHRNQDATCYVGDLDPEVTEPLLWELFTQVGPVVNVHIPKDKLSSTQSKFGFVELRSEEDAEYAINILNFIKLYGKAIRVNKASRDKQTQDIGANLFIGNLDSEVDEKMLYDTFSAFGAILGTPKVMRDPETGESRGFGFVSYNSFEAADAAIETMNSQFLYNRSLNVTYAYKKDTKGERHGTQAERLLAANRGATSKPNTMFAAGAAFGGGAMPPPVAGAPPGMPPPPPPHMGGGHMPPGMPPPPPPHMAGGHMPPGMPPPPHMMGGHMPPHGMPPPPGGRPGMPPPPHHMPPHGMPPPPHMAHGMPPPPPPRY